MYSNSYEVNMICRICLSKETNLIDIFSSTLNVSSISIAIMECAPVLISKTDTLPHTICTYCLGKLEIAYDFRILCIKSDQTLRNNVTVAVKNEDDSNDSKLEIDPITVVKKEKGNNDDNDINKNREIEPVVKEENSYDEFVLNSSQVSPAENDISLPGIFDIKKFDNDRVKRRLRSKKLKNRTRKNEKCLLTASEDGFYHCKQCTRKYKYKFNLKEHLKSHLNLRYRCDQCGKEFDQDKYLKRHMLDVHTIERKYACEFCGTLCRSKDYLRRHQKTHSTEREYKCKICEKAFKSNEQLNKHSAVHKDERPWICGNCGKGFKRRDHLALHEQTHGGKRFKCVKCSQTFLTRQNLKYHVIKICSRNS